MPLLLAVFTKAGFERVYLPLTVVFVIIGAVGATEVWKRVAAHRKWLVVLYGCGILFNYTVYPEVWKMPAPTEDTKQVLIDNDSSVLPIITSTTSFPVLINDLEIAKNLESRSVFPERLLMLECANGVFNGADLGNNEQEISFPVSGVFHPGKIPGYMYKLTPIESVSANETVLAVVAGRIPLKFLELPGKKLRLNLWLNQHYKLYVCNFAAEDIPYFAEVKYFRIGEAK